MKILENHFNGNDTLILGQYIFNGCQRFHVRDSDEIFKEFEVPLNLQEEVLSYIDYSQDFDYLKYFANDELYDELYYRIFIYDILLTVEELIPHLHLFCEHTDLNVLRICSERCLLEYLHLFYKSDYWFIRKNCVSRCNLDDVHLFINDNDLGVRKIAIGRLESQH